VRTLPAALLGLRRRHRADVRATLLVLWALALAMLPLHSGLEQHSALEGPTEIFLTAQHVGGSGCLEGATPVELPACLACVLQLKTAASAVPAPAVVPVFVAVGTASEPSLASGGRVAPRLAPARAPPVA